VTYRHVAGMLDLRKGGDDPRRESHAGADGCGGSPDGGCGEGENIAIRDKAAACLRAAGAQEDVSGSDALHQIVSGGGIVTTFDGRLLMVVYGRTEDDSRRAARSSS
jgi:hypothetical protein